ncbi:MAG: tRNA (guanosine(37)-N1)-methyltransferase TrmD [Eubacterium sp.]|nr:tRNA (guanosine(37)-N1)-methyltransferase TrmD [Eubacterium sp.]
MHFYILTLFPDMIEQVVHTSIIGRAVSNGILSVHAVNIRDYTTDKHNKVDDYPYGGGAGMVMQAQPVYDAWQAVTKEIKSRRGQSQLHPRTIYLTPQAAVFKQSMAKQLACEQDLILLCGHYEGIDERVLEEIVTDYVSIGDYVLTGGELPALVVADAVARMVPGVLTNAQSASTESLEGSLLEHPQYSRPEEWNGKTVPAVLLSGNHANVDAWRREQSILRTKERRPDLLAQAKLTQKEQERYL